MKTKNGIRIFAILGLSLFFLCFESCKKEEKNPVPVLTTNAVTGISQTSASSGGTIISDEGSTILTRGICWSTGTSPGLADSITSEGAGAGSFTSNMNSLIPGTKYFVRAYATNIHGTGYGMAMSFITLEAQLPVLNTIPAVDITMSTASCGGFITFDGGNMVTERGVCYGTNSNPTIASSILDPETGTGSFVTGLTGLTNATTYFIRAYATNSIGTAYGDELSFTTLTGMASVSTAIISAITGTSASGGGNIYDEGGAAITARGVCYGSSEYPTTSNSFTIDGDGIGEFESSITGLTNEIRYYVRAYATNSFGTSYGNQVSFTSFDPYAHLNAGWHFDEGTGNTAAAFSNEPHLASFFPGNSVILGAAAMSPSWVTGVRGGSAVYLDKGAHLEVPYTPSFLPVNLSISVWIKPIEFYENNYIVSQNYWNGYKLQIQGEGRPFFTFRKADGNIVDHDIEVTNAINTGQWNHIVVTLNNTTFELKFYVGGTIVKTWTNLGGPLIQTLTDPGPQPFIIGCVATDAEIARSFMDWITPENFGYFRGAIDELEIYDIPLNDEQVSDIYNKEKP